MRQFWGLTRRNLLVYFKDVQAVLFSMLTSIIVFVLFVLFLRQSYADSITQQAALLGQLVRAEDIEMFTYGLLLSGLMGSAVITVSYHSLTTIVHDREKRIDYDISATPIRRWQIILSYFTASVCSAVVMACLVLTAGLIFVMARGSLYLTFGDVAALYGLTVLAALSAASLFMLVVLFFKTTSASGAFFGILSAASGFVIGAFMPISQFSKPVQSFCGIFPGTGVTSLYRRILLGRLLRHMDAGIGGVDGGAFVRGLEEAFAAPLRLLGRALTPGQTLLYVAALILVCVAAICVIYPKVYQRK